MRKSVHVIIGLLILVGAVISLKWLTTSPFSQPSKPHYPTPAPVPKPAATPRPVVAPAAKEVSPVIVDENVREDIEKAVGDVFTGRPADLRAVPGQQ
ncbi:MAG: hypothetical protein QM755_15525 [Luteolibacter sp.]